MIKKLSESFSESVSKRTLKKDDSNQILGSEIRLNRTALELTLKSLAYKTCSVSYVSKIETNSIEGKPQYLSEICERVNISANDIDKLKDARNTCFKIIELVYYSRESEIEKIYEEIKDYKNFRHLIIDLYYFFFSNNYRKFETICNKISKILSTLNDIDFSLYGYICARYQIQMQNIDEAVAILEELEKYGTEDYRLQTLINYELLNIYFKSNDIKFFLAYDKVIEFSKKTCDVIYVKKVYEYQELFFIQNKLINQLPTLYVNLSNPSSKLYEYFVTLAKHINTYFVVLEYLSKNVKEFPNISKIDETFIAYMDLKPRDVYKSIDLILREALPLSYKENNEFYITFYTIELKNFYKDNARYKRYYEVDSDYRDHLAKKTSR